MKRLLLFFILILSISVNNANAQIRLLGFPADWNFYTYRDSLTLNKGGNFYVFGTDSFRVYKPVRLTGSLNIPTLILDNISAPAFVGAADSILLASAPFGGDVSGTYEALVVANDSHSHAIGTSVSGLGTGVATWLATPSSANLASAVTGETGSGSLVFATGPTFSGFSSTGTAGIDSINAGYLSQIHIRARTAYEASYVVNETTYPLGMYFRRFTVVNGDSLNLKTYLPERLSGDLLAGKLTISTAFGAAEFLLMTASPDVAELADPVGIFTTTKGTASSINVYYSSPTATVYIENLYTNMDISIGYMVLQ